jgi:membrane protein required for colicin V production
MGKAVNQLFQKPMLIDVVFLILVVLAAIKGMRNGLIVALFSLIGFIVGMAAAVKLSTVAAGYIGSAVNISDRWLPLVAFIVVFVLVVFLVRLGARALEGVVQVAMLGWLNRLGGVLFYVLLYVFIFSIVLFYLSQINIIKPEAAQESVTYGFIQPMGPKVIEGLSAVVPLFKNMFAELEAFFSGVLEKKSATLPVSQQAV